ncbi:MAG: hypothetical protein ACO3F5_10150, partial [Gemmatimonadaceae bacterium]
MSRPAAAPRSLADRTSRLRRVPARAFAMVLLLLQATTGVLFPLVDAAGPHETTVAAHWDGESERHCPPQHSEGDCLVVKSLTASALPAVTRPAVVGATALDHERETEPTAQLLGEPERLGEQVLRVEQHDRCSRGVG